jgi:hypothetical protein
MEQIAHNNMFIDTTLSNLRTTYEGAIKSGVLQPMPEKPSLTQRFKQGFSDMGKTVKNAATSATGAVASRFSRKNKSGEEKGLELQELNNNPEQQSTLTEPTQVNNEGRLAKMRKATNERLEKMKTATKGGLEKVGTAFSNVGKIFTKKNKEQNPNKYTLLPNYTNEPQPQDGGNKTRKNRQHQYIHEIKKNRNELFNKEMEILNSIRNFKHGHIDNDNTKKQFMKAVKRG